MFSPFLHEQLDRPTTWEEHFVDVSGGNLAVAKWRHEPDASAFDDGGAFRAISGALREDNNDPLRLRKPAVEIAALLPPPTARKQSEEALCSLWKMFVSLAQQTPSGNIAMLDLVVILDHLSASPKAAATVTVVSCGVQGSFFASYSDDEANQDGFEQLSRLHGLNQIIRNHMKCRFHTRWNPRPPLSLRLPMLGLSLIVLEAPYDDVEDRKRSLYRFINLNAFAALLWSYNLVDGRDFAIQQLRSAFEDRRSSNAGDRDGADARLMAAAQWAIYSCQRLYHLSVTCEPASADGGGGGPAGGGGKRWQPGARFKGRAGFSFQRWEFWQQGFEEAKELGNGGIEAKVEAEAAAGMMEKVLYAGFEV